MIIDLFETKSAILKIQGFPIVANPQSMKTLGKAENKQAGNIPGNSSNNSGSSFQMPFPMSIAKSSATSHAKPSAQLSRYCKIYLSESLEIRFLTFLENEWTFLGGIVSKREYNIYFKNYRL